MREDIFENNLFTVLTFYIKVTFHYNILIYFQIVRNLHLKDLLFALMNLRKKNLIIY